MLKRVYNRLLKAYRRSTGAQRCAPDFLICGAQKSGTTSLFRYIEQHPGIQMSFDQEVGYFDLKYDMGENWYKAQFPLVRKKGKLVVGENTPNYMFYPHSAERIKRTNDKAKIIFLLRDPVIRAYSQFWHEVRLGHESLPLADAMLQEDDRVKGELAELESAVKDHSHALFHWAYKLRGEYATQIKRFLQVFPKDQILVMDHAQLNRNPQHELSKLCTFLDLGAYKFDVKARHNVNPSYDVKEDEIYDHLLSHFQSPNQELYDLIGERFDWTGTPNDTFK